MLTTLEKTPWDLPQRLDCGLTCLASLSRGSQMTGDNYLAAALYTTSPLKFQTLASCKKGDASIAFEVEQQVFVYILHKTF